MWLFEKKVSRYNHRKEKHILDLIEYCRKIKPYVYFYKWHIKSSNETAHNILENEIHMILPKFPDNRKEKRGIFATLISGFIALAYEGISSFLHNIRHKALHKAVRAIDRQATKWCNKHMHSKDST